GRWVVLTRIRGRACRAPQLGIAWGINSRVRESTTKIGWTNTPAQDHWPSPGRLAGRTRTPLQGGGPWLNPPAPTNETSVWMTESRTKTLSVCEPGPDPHRGGVGIQPVVIQGRRSHGRRTYHPDPDRVESRRPTVLGPTAVGQGAGPAVPSCP